MSDGKAGVFELLAATGDNYEAGVVNVDGNFVGVHGRFDGDADTFIVYDLFRVDGDCLLAEHWDVIQSEVSPTVSGNPMFETIEGALDV